MKRYFSGFTLLITVAVGLLIAQKHPIGLGGAGSGTVTNTGGALASNAVVLGAGGADTKVSTGITTNGASELDVGVVGTNGVLGLKGLTSGTAMFTAPAVAGTASNPVVMTNALITPQSGLLCTTGTYYGGFGTKTGMTSASSNSVDLCANGAETLQATTTGIFANQPICDFAVGNNCLTFAAGLISVTGAGNAILHSSNNTKNVGTSDFTSANSAALQAITGLSFPLGSTAQVFSFHCSLVYSQATNVAGDQFGVGVITTAPTNVNVQGTAFQNTTVITQGVLNGLATTTPTAVVTFQPGVTTVLGATLDGTIETAGGGAATFNVYVLNGTAADVIVIKRGSYCTIY